MSDRNRVALALVAAALLLGIAGDVLFQGQPLGLNAFLWAALCTLALAVLLRVARAALHQGRRLMVAPVLVFAGLFAWHDSPVLVAANLLALAAAVAMGALRRTKPQLRTATLSDYGSGLLAAACAAAAGSIPLLMADVRWQDVRRRLRSERTAAVARGLALGVPLLLVFGALFVAADAVFQNLVSSAVPTISLSVAGRVVLVLVWAWLTAGLLRDLLAEREEERLVSVPAIARDQPRLGPLEVAVALAALDLLFLAFVIVQFRYLFGGAGLVESRAHLTYAAYARHGFFELVAVAALTLPLLLAADWFLRDADRRAFRWLAATLLVLLFVVIASALERMRLYEHEYGLTELRLYATGFIVWLAVVCAWFAATVLRGRRHVFAVGTLVLGFAATLAFNVLDPDALIARTNLTRPSVDLRYLAGLGDDAVPTLVARLGTLPPAERRELAFDLLDRGTATHGWRSWNLARSRAAGTLRAHRAELQRIAATSR